MRLLHITATHLNLAGGIPVVLRDLVRAQNEIDGFEAKVLSIKADISNMASEYFEYLENSSFEKYVDSYEPDVVVFHSHYYFEYLRLYGLLIKRKIPYYIEPHGSFGKAALKKSKLRKQIANGIILRQFMKHAYGYIFLNEAEQIDAQFRSAHDLIIPNGINTNNLEKDINPRNQWHLYFIGRFDVIHKGLDYLFDAFEILDKEEEKMSIKLYGTGTEEEIEYVNNRIHSLHSISVTNCGPIYGEEQAKALEQCGIMLLTSRYEGFPMTVLEAWKYGNPCIVTPGTNLTEEVENNALGWTTELEKSEIATTIKKACKSYLIQRDGYIHTTKEYVTDNYSWDRIASISYNVLKKKVKDEV